GFAMDLEVTAHAGVSEIIALGGSLRIVTNVSGVDQRINIPRKFIEDGYLPPDAIAERSPIARVQPGQLQRLPGSFIDRLEITKDEDGNPISWAYVVPGGAPLWKGGNREQAGPYVVAQGTGTFYIVDVFVVDAAFRIERSTGGLFIQLEGGLRLKDLGKANASGYMELTKQGIVVAMDVDLDAPVLHEVGITMTGAATLKVNTTATDRTIQPLTDRLLLAPMEVKAGEADVKAEGLLAFNIPGTDIEVARIRGVFSLDTHTERTTIFAAGELEIGPRGLRVFEMTVLGVFAIVEGGFATDLTVTSTGGLPDVAELTGTFRLVSNMTRIEQEVPVPQRFIDGGFLTQDFLNRLGPSSADPTQKSYYVPAGAPYLDSTPNDAPSAYIVMMGQGTLTLVNTFDITAGFRIRIETNGPVIPIDARMDLGPFGWVAVFGKAELNLSGLTAGLSVDMDNQGLRAAGLDFNVDAVIGINTSNEEVVIVSEESPDAEPIVVPPKTYYYRAGGLIGVRVPQTNVELFRMQGTYLLEITPQGLGVFVDASILVGPAVDLINASVTGVFIMTPDGIAAELDLEFSSKSDVFDDAFQFNVDATAVLNTTGMELGVVIPDRFMQYLSPRAIARLKSPAPGLPANVYTVPAGAPLLNGENAAPGFYIVFSMQGFVRIADAFDLTGSLQMVFANNIFEVTFDASMKLLPFGDVAAYGFLQIDEHGLAGALNLELDTPGLRAAGLDIDVDAVLAVNTTDQQVIVTSDQNPNAEQITIPRKTRYIRAAGLIGVRVPQTDIELFQMQGLFLMESNSQGLVVFADAGITVGAAIDLIEASVTGVFMVTTSGLAADIDLVFSAKSRVFEDAFSFDVEARAAFNTTGQEMGIIVPDRFMQYLSPRAKARLTSPGPDLPANAYTVPAGAPLLGGGNAAPGFYIVFGMQGFVRIVRSFDLNGSFQMVFANNTFEVGFDAQLRLDPIGQVDASGSLTMHQQGLVGALQLGGRFELGPVKIYGAMQLEVNSTSTDLIIERVQYDFKNKVVSSDKVPVTIPRHSQRIFVGGFMEIPGFKLEGSFEFANNPNEIRVSVDASFRAFDALFLGVDGDVAIVKGTHPGLVMNLDAYVKAGFFGVDEVFDLNATFELKVNTRPGDGSDHYDYGVQRGYTRVGFDGSMSLLSTIDLDVSGYIEAYLGVFRAEINGSAEILGQSIYGRGYFSSEGEFSLAFGGSLQVGPAGFGVSGSADFEISRLDGNGTEAFGDGNYVINVYGLIEGSVQLFGISLFGARIQFGLEKATGRVYITPSVKVLFWEVSTTFNLFYVKVPPPIYLGGNADDSGPAVWQKGTLYLNIGARASFRNISNSEINEGIVVKRLGDDPEFSGEILQVEAFGRRQNFRGVTAIVANGGEGHDYIEIGPGVKAPVTLRGGARRDFVRSWGSGPAVIDGGEGDDVLQGGFAENTFVFSDSFGRDTLSSLGTQNDYDFSPTSEDLQGDLTAEQFTMLPSGYNRLVVASVQIGGRDAVVVPNTGLRQTVILRNHGFAAGERISISSQSHANYNREFTVVSATNDTIVIDSPFSDRLLPTGVESSQGPIWHDGDQTAYIRTTINDWEPGYELPLESSTTGYNGYFEVQRISSDWYSFSIDWTDIREILDTPVIPRDLTFGTGSDFLSIPGSLSRTLNLFSPAGGADTLRIRGSLSPSQKMVQGVYENHALLVIHSGLERIELFDPGANLTLGGGTPEAAIELGSMAIGVAAQSLTIPVPLRASGLEINVRDAFTQLEPLIAGDFNIRVFGDHQGITLTAPVIAAESVQLVAPDGAVILPAGTQFTSAVVVIKAASVNVPEDLLTLSTDSLTFITPQGTAQNLNVANNRSLLLTSESDSEHMVNLDASIAQIFSGIAWVAGIASDWAQQIFDGAMNPWAVAVDGLLDVRVAPSPVDSEYGLEVRGGLRSWNGDIRLVADEVDFLGGRNSVKGPGSLTLQAASNTWTYRLGTSAETGGGAPFAQVHAPRIFDLPTRDIAAIANGFNQITIGRGDQGNVMRLGDAFSMTQLKSNGDPRVVDASIKDPLTLLSDLLIVEGDFRAPADPIVVNAGQTEVRKVNLHTPNNAQPDSGLTASSITLNVTGSLQVGGWIRGSQSVNIGVTETINGFSVVTDPGSEIRQTDVSGTLSIVGDAGIRIAGAVSSAANAAEPLLFAGTTFDALAGADIAVTGTNSVLRLTAGNMLSFAPGSTVRAGSVVTFNGDTPAYSVTSGNSGITIDAPQEVLLAGTMVASGRIAISAGPGKLSHADYFADLYGANTQHYLASHDYYSILQTGTIVSLGNDQEVLITAAEDVILIGNIVVSGTNSDLTVQSDRFVFVEGKVSVSDTLQVFGGVSLNGTRLSGFDARGSSVYLGAAGMLNTTRAGSEIVVSGDRDV
ncbi:MAG: hypothetical protein RL215_447, partial [Planctomycetota bacterium]